MPWHPVGRRLVTVMVELLVCSALLVSAPRVSASAWCDAATVFYAPSSGTAGQPVAFQFQYVNGLTGPADYVYILSFQVLYSWDPTQYDLGNATVSPNGGSATFTHSEPLPLKAATYSWQLGIYARTAFEIDPSLCYFGPTTFPVLPAPLSAGMTANVTSGVSPLAVQFQATAAGGVAPYTYSWAFGDKATGTGAIANHTYPSAGNYTVTLTVRDASSHSVTRTLTIRVTVAPPTAPVAGQSFVPLAAYAAIAVAVAATVALVIMWNRKRTKGSPKPPNPQGMPPEPPAPPTQ